MENMGILKSGAKLKGENNTYIIHEYIAKGGSSIIYAAHSGFERYVIKELWPQNDPKLKLDRNNKGTDLVLHSPNMQNKFEEHKKAFLEEYTIGSKFKNSKHLIKPCDYIATNNTCYIVMPEENGKILSQYLREQSSRLTLDASIDIILALIHNLKHLYDEEELLHLDINLNNVFIDFSERNGIKTKLLDFGTSRSLNDSHDVKCITNGFSAPEVYNNNISDLNFTTDLYSLFSIFLKVTTNKDYNIQNSQVEYQFYIESYHPDDTFIENNPENIKALSTKGDIIEQLDSMFKKVFQPDSYQRKLQLHSHDYLISWLKYLKQANEVYNIEQQYKALSTQMGMDDLLEKSKVQLHAKKRHLSNFREDFLPYLEYNNQTISIEDFPLDTIEHHLYIHGEGGIGKTTALIYLWDKLLESDKLPIYIPLNAIQDSSVPSLSLIKYIIAHYLYGGHPIDDIDGNYKDDFQQISKLFRDHSRGPKIFLLLDGLNEMNHRSQRMFIRGISEGLMEWMNVQVIITSRTHMYISNDFRTLWFKGIQTDTLRDILSQTSIKAVNIEYLLNKPMYLQLYLNFPEDQFVNMSSLLNFGLRQSNNKTFEQESKYNYLLELIMPYIGFQMFELELYRINYSSLKLMIEFAIDKNNHDLVRQTYIEYIDEIELSKDSKKLIDVIVHEMNLMTIDSNFYMFLHQDYRDYFAAKYILMQTSLAENGLESDRDLLNQLYDIKHLHHFLAELKPNFESVLKSYKNHQNIEYAIYNILEVLKIQYNNLLNHITFDGIDFKMCNLTEIYFSDAKTASKFIECTFYEENFRKKDPFNIVDYNLISHHGKLYLKDKTKNKISYEINSNQQNLIDYVNSKTNLLVRLNEKDNVLIIRNSLHSDILHYKLSDKTNDPKVTYSNDSNYILLNYNNHLDKLDTTKHDLNTIDCSNKSTETFKTFDFSDYYVKVNKSTEQLTLNVKHITCSSSILFTLTLSDNQELCHLELIDNRYLYAITAISDKFGYSDTEGSVFDLSTGNLIYSYADTWAKVLLSLKGNLHSIEDAKLLKLNFDTGEMDVVFDFKGTAIRKNISDAHHFTVHDDTLIFKTFDSVYQFNFESLVCKNLLLNEDRIDEKRRYISLDFSNNSILYFAHIYDYVKGEISAYYPRFFNDSMIPKNSVIRPIFDYLSVNYYIDKPKLHNLEFPDTMAKDCVNALNKIYTKWIQTGYKGDFKIFALKDGALVLQLDYSTKTDCYKIIKIDGTGQNMFEAQIDYIESSSMLFDEYNNTILTMESSYGYPTVKIFNLSDAKSYVLKVPKNLYMSKVIMENCKLGTTWKNSTQNGLKPSIASRFKNIFSKEKTEINPVKIFVEDLSQYGVKLLGIQVTESSFHHDKMSYTMKNNPKKKVAQSQKSNNATHDGNVYYIDDYTTSFLG